MALGMPMSMMSSLRQSGAIHLVIRQIAPRFFTNDIPGTLAYYKGKLGFECLGMWRSTRS